MELTVSCQTASKLTVKKFHVTSNLIISAGLHGILASEETLNWKYQLPCSQNYSFSGDITRLYNRLISENTLKQFKSERAI